MSTQQLLSLILGAVLHVTSLVSLVVLVALGKLSWAEAGPIIGGLVGLGVGVPLTISAVGSPAASTPSPAAPASAPAASPAAPAPG